MSIVAFGIAIERFSFIRSLNLDDIKDRFKNCEKLEIELTSIMVGLSLALKATAVGFLVAIPCVFLNNMLLRRVREKRSTYNAMKEKAGYGA